MKKINWKPSEKIEIFHNIGCESLSWFLKAKELRSASEALVDAKNQIESSNVSLMLFGMAMETLFKAWMIEQGEIPILTINGAFCLAKSFKTHDLVVLYKSIKNPIAIFETKDLTLLEFLTDFIVWKGRYPVPLRPAAESATFVRMSQWPCLIKLFDSFLPSDLIITHTTEFAPKKV